MLTAPRKANVLRHSGRYLISTYRFENLHLTTAKMVRTSVLHDALNNINNAEKAGKRQVMIRPSSKVIVKFLQVMQKHGTSHASHADNPPATRYNVGRSSHPLPTFGMITRRRSIVLPTA